MSDWADDIEQITYTKPIEPELAGEVIGDYRVVTTEIILEEETEPVPDYLPPTVISSSRLPGWRISGLYNRRIFKSRGQTLDRHHRTYREKQLIKGALGKKAQKRRAKQSQQQVEKRAFHDDRFMPWQNELAQYIHTGYNVILDIATSCGKSWATTMITAYETLCDDTATSIFISPNSEIMRETVAEIRKYNYKHYLSASKRMLDTQTRSYCTYDEKTEPTSQIMCITADNFISFITNEVNHNFIKQLKYLVFDEVHLDEVAKTLWWSTLLPQRAQFLLLSATLGDVSKTIDELRSHGPTHPIKVIKYNIRPIPLQRVMFKGCDAPKTGYRCSTLKGARRLLCQVNQFDPTARDIKSLDRKLKLEKDREKQYHQGQVVVKMTDSSMIEKSIQDDLKTAVVDPTAENVYNLLSYVFSNGMQPALVFHTSSSGAQKMAKNLVKHISSVELNDPEFRRASKLQNSLDKTEKRARDKRAEEEKKMADTGNRWTKMPEDKTDEVDTAADIHSILLKWKFPSQLEEIPTNIPAWVQECLNYGIGVYLHSFPAWLRYKLFDSFKEGKLQVMIADATISVGINLPVRTCILCGEDMTPAIYKQMGGRAGRRGYDNQGYIIPMFPKDRVLECLMTDTSPVSINMPTDISYTELIRLLTPGELGNFYAPESKTDPERPKEPGSQFELPGRGGTLKDIILEKYIERSNRDKIELQIETIKEQMWHYHRLTNMIQSLPYDETMIFMQLLANGELRSIDTTQMIELISLLFQTKPAKSSDDQLELTSTLAPRILEYAKYFGITHDFSKPVSRYFMKFCRDQKYTVDDVENIEKIGEWLYILKRYVTAVTPRDDHIRKLVEELDERFIAASKAVDLL